MSSSLKSKFNESSQNISKIVNNGNEDDMTNILFTNTMSNNEDFNGDASNDERLRLLKEKYSIAKQRAADLSSTVIALPLRLHSQQASKIYSAIANLLYAHITVSKSAELERYIRKKAW